MDRRLSFLACLLCVPILLLSAPALFAAELRLTSDTLLRAFERETSGGEDVVVPLYQYLKLDTGELGGIPLTFHFNGWGRIDLAGSDYFQNTFAGGGESAGEVLYGYLEYIHPETGMSARLGRQYIFEGVSNESIDGLRVRSDLGDRFALSLYGGWPVALDGVDGRGGDAIYGGRLAHHDRRIYEVGLSYKSVFNDGSQAEEMVGADFALFLPAGVSLFGLSSWNLETDGWAEHAYEARFRLGRFSFRPFFEHYRYDHYFGRGENTGRPFVFHPPFGERLTAFGADVMWMQNDAWEWGAKAKFFDYDERGDSARFFSGVGIWQGGDTQAGGELGWMNGDRAQDRYILGRLFIYQDALTLPLLRFATGEVVTVWYDEDIYGEDLAVLLSVGGGTRFLRDALEVRLAVDYSTDPYFDDDLRGWLLARYAFSL